MNNQEAFDKVWQWFIVERHGPGMLTRTKINGTEVRDCRYFIDPQTKCAVGCLVSDEIAATLMDLQGITHIADRYFPEIEVKFLVTLRRVHDHSALGGNFHNELESQLRELIGKFGLHSPDSIAIENLIEETKLETATA